MSVWIVNEDVDAGGDPILGDTDYMIRLQSTVAWTLVGNLLGDPTWCSTIRGTGGAFENAALHVVITNMPGDIDGGSTPLTAAASVTYPDGGIIEQAAALSVPMNVYPGFRLDPTAGTVGDPPAYRSGDACKRRFAGWFHGEHWSQMAEWTRTVFALVPTGRTEMVWDIEPYYIHGGEGGPHRYPTATAITYYQTNTNVSLEETSGTASPPTVTITGTAGASYVDGTLVIDIDGAGALGAATFRWSTDGGATWTASGVTTGASVALGATGLTAVFGAGTYNANHVWEGWIVGPYPTLTAADLTTAMTPLLDVIDELDIRPCMYPCTSSILDPDDPSFAHTNIYNAAGGYGELWGEETFGITRSFYNYGRTANSLASGAASDVNFYWNQYVAQNIASPAGVFAQILPRCEVRIVDNDDILREFGKRAEMEAVCGRLKPWIFDINREAADQAAWGLEAWWDGTLMNALNDVAHVWPMRGTNYTHLSAVKTAHTATNPTLRYWKRSRLVGVGAGENTISTELYDHSHMGVRLQRSTTDYGNNKFQTLLLYREDDDVANGPFSALCPYPYSATGADQWTLDFTIVLPVGFDAANGVIAACNGFNLDEFVIMFRTAVSTGSTPKIQLRLNNAGALSYYDIVDSPVANTEYRIIVGRGLDGGGASQVWIHGANRTDVGFTVNRQPTSVHIGAGALTMDASDDDVTGISSTENVYGRTMSLELRGSVHVWHRTLTQDEVDELLAAPTSCYPWGLT